MATALDVIKGSLKLLGIQPAETPVEDVEASDGLISLNDLMAELEEDDICIGYEALTDVNDTIYVDDSMIGPMKAVLAEYIAPEYSRVVTPTLEKRARRARLTMRSSVHFRTGQYPDTLPVGSGNEGTGYSGNGDVPGDGYGNRFYPGNVDYKCN